MVINALAISGIIILLFGLTDNEIGQAISGFMMAGIIPGTAYQIPWYAIMIGAPIALLGLAKVFLVILAQDIARKISLLRLGESAQSITAKKKPTSHVKRTRKSPGTARAKNLPARKLTQAEA